jgi:alanine racemase
LIDLDALRHNYHLARHRHGGRALAVIKANAYGHGAVPCARALEQDADGFAVAILEEALELRAAGLRKPILVLEGVFEACELAAVVQHDLWIVVHHDAQLRMIETTGLARPLTVWLKLNTGMNRAGFEAAALRPAWLRLRDSGKVGEITLMSHLARADEPQVITTTEQIARFDDATGTLPGPRSLSNSAGVLGWPQARRDWARPGILLYGADPMPHQRNGLRPVMTLESVVMSVRDIDCGAAIGYGARFRAERPTRVGLVALGYADGYPRSAPDGTAVTVDGLPARLIGRVSMDMLTVDLTDLPNTGPGSRVQLWGELISVNDVAAAAGTIAYELLCNVKRVRFEYGGQRAG